MNTHMYIHSSRYKISFKTDFRFKVLVLIIKGNQTHFHKIKSIKYNCVSRKDTKQNTAKNTEEIPSMQVAIN